MIPFSHIVAFSYVLASSVFVSLRVPPSTYIFTFHYKCVLGQHKQTMRLLTRETWTCCGDRERRLGKDATENIYSGCIISFPMVFGQQEIPKASASIGLIIYRSFHLKITVYY